MKQTNTRRVSNTPREYHTPLAQLDPLNYDTHRLRDTEFVTSEWINHDVSLRPPVVNHSYNDRTARTAEGIRLLG
jgi:hypothetical protein